MVAPPNAHAVFAIVLALLAIFLYTREKLSLESSSFFILAVIVLWFELWPIEYEGARVRAADFFAGFGNEALIAVVSLMILARSLEVTNALQPIGHALAGLWSGRSIAQHDATQQRRDSVVFVATERVSRSWRVWGYTDADRSHEGRDR